MQREDEFGLIRNRKKKENATRSYLTTQIESTLLSSLY